MAKKSAYAAELSAMPVGLDRAIVRVLSFHVGRARAIGRMDLVEQVGVMGCPATERQVRDQIKQLRRDGYLICSVAGEDGGYFMAETLIEYKDFARIEFEGKISDMSETLQAMNQTARKLFGDSMQPGLF